MSLIKSKQRVADHGEVFTPAWMVEAMLDLVKGETERIDSRFLESACGSGNFLVRILQRRDFRLDTLSRMSALSEEGSHFAHLGKHEIFKPASTYPPMTACEIAFIAQKESA